MAKLNIIFWSGTGNTEKMAEYIGEGASSKGAEIDVIGVDSANGDSFNSDIIALGCPSMGAEELESEIDEFIDSNKDKINGKTVGLFGSYDWGDGEWMRLWKEQMEGYGATVVGEGCIVNLTPEGGEIEKCKDYGKAIVAG